MLFLLRVSVGSSHIPFPLYSQFTLHSIRVQAHNGGGDGRSCQQHAQQQQWRCRHARRIRQRGVVVVGRGVGRGGAAQHSDWYGAGVVSEEVAKIVIPLWFTHSPRSPPSLVPDAPPQVTSLPCSRYTSPGHLPPQHSFVRNQIQSPMYRTVQHCTEQQGS